MTDWDIAARIKPQTTSDIVSPLTAFTNMQLSRARAQEVGLQAQQYGALYQARQNTNDLVKQGMPAEKAVITGGLSAIDPAGANQFLANVQKQREISAVRGYDPKDPASLAAGGPALVKQGWDVVAAPAGIAKTQADTQSTQAKTMQEHLQLRGQIGQAFLAAPTPQNWDSSVNKAYELGLITPTEVAQFHGHPDMGIARQWAAAGGSSVTTSGIASYNEGVSKAATTVQKLSPGETIAAAPAAAAAMGGAAVPPFGGGAPPGTPVSYMGATSTGQPVQVDAQGRAIQNAQPQAPGAPAPMGGGAIPPSAPGAAPPPPSPGQSAAGAASPLFSRAAGMADGFSPAGLARTAQIESGGNPNITNKSGAAGLMQFMPATWRQYGQGSPLDPVQATAAAQRLAADNKRALTNSLGREPTDAELYLAHQQGAGGAAGLLENPNAPASSIIGMKALVGNGGNANMTAGQFAQMWINKFNQPGRSGSFALSGPAGGNFGPDMTMPANAAGNQAISAIPPSSPVAPVPLPGQSQQAQRPPLAVAPPSPLPANGTAGAIAPVPQAPVAGQVGPASPLAQAAGATAPSTGLPADRAATPLITVAGTPLSLEQAAQQREQGGQNVKQINEAREQFQSATSGQQNILQLMGALSKIPEGGGKGVESLLAPGTGATERIGLAKAVNTALQGAGIAPMFDPSKISAAEESQKITGRLGFDLSRSRGAREAAQVVQQAISLNPGVENSPQGARVVAAAINAALQRQRDFYIFQQAYARQNNGSPVGAEIAFDRASPVSAYVHDAGNLARVPEKAVEMLQKNPGQAGSFDEFYGPHLSRYFIGQ